MTIHFEKYQGTGNDFILINGFKYPDTDLSTDQIAALCHRRFGIGADGLIILRPVEGYDFEMNYFNADGRPGTMCGNGGRCSVLYAVNQALVTQEAHFLASDGPHRGSLINKNKDTALISLSMHADEDIKKINEFEFELNTGSPHFVRVVSSLESVDVFLTGRQIRTSPVYKEQGINVNFLETCSDHIKLATYERGVEDVTFSCGTGVTAAAIVAVSFLDYTYPVRVMTQGGILEVSRAEDRTTGSVVLTGEAGFVFSGTLEI